METFIKKYGISASTLKIVALVLMIINHAFNAVYNQVYRYPTWIYYAEIVVTRGSFIIYAFLLSESMCYTSSRLKYFLRLFLFAFISEFPADYAIYGEFPHDDWQNVFFELALAVAMISFMDNVRLIPIKFIIFGVCCFISIKLKLDYSLIGLCVIASFYYLRGNKWRIPVTAIIFVVMCLIDYIFLYTNGYPDLSFSTLWPYIIKSFWLEASGILMFPFLYLYNGEKGRQLNKYFYYAMYPLHMAAIAFAIKIYLNK